MGGDKIEKNYRENNKFLKDIRVVLHSCEIFEKFHIAKVLQSQS